MEAPTNSNDEGQEAITVATSHKSLKLKGTPPVELELHCWRPAHQNLTSVAIIYHGFGAHARYPTVKYAAELLAKECHLTVYSADMQGHGISQGERGLLPTTSKLLEHAAEVAQYVRSIHPSAKLLLVGSSMGGALCLHTSLHPDLAPHVRGMVLLAPLLSLNVSSVEILALNCLSAIIPNWAVIPSSSTSPEAQYRDAERREECQNDNLSYSGKLKPQSALTCVELAEKTKSIHFLSKISSPFWLAIATEDVVVKNDMAHKLMDVSATPPLDKVIKSYPALHGLLCETQPLRGQIEKDMIEWVNARCTKPRS